MTNCFKNRYTLQVSNDTVAFCLNAVVSSFNVVLCLLNVFGCFEFLKRLCHENIAVLGQFCADVITWCLYQYTKCSCKVMKNISNKLYQGALTIIIFW